VQDLLTVISDWGCGCTDGPPPIEDVEDCMEFCAGLYTWGSPEWIECVEKCSDALEQ
jgi:hypothetical protein